MLKLNQIYKVKEGHEGKCDTYKDEKGKYIRITDFRYDILNEGKKTIDYCSCFTEDDLEEEVKEIQGIGRALHEDLKKLYPNQKSLEDLEEKLLVKIDLPNDNRLVKIKLIGNVLDCQYNQSEQEIYVYSQTPEIHELSPSEAETLLEEKLGYKVKIK